MAAPPRAAPTFAHATPLSLTESHLSVEGSSSAAVGALEATQPWTGPKARLPALPPSIQSGTSSTTLDDSTGLGGGPLKKNHSDDIIEKGPFGPDAPEEAKVVPKAADGSDVIVVDWKGPDDPAFPKNWTKKRRMGATVIVASFTFLSPLSSTMVAPAIGQIATKFHITSEVEQSMVTSIFVLAYAFGPLLLGPSSEIWGRTRVLQLANLVYLAFNFACGFATNKNQMLAFRFLAGLGGSAPLAIGAGVLGDIWRPEERGRAAALYSLGPLLGPALGPVSGGWIAQCLPNDGYRWVFFSTTIACVLIQISGAIFLRESYAPTLLHRQAQALKKQLGLDPKSDKVQTVFEIQGGHKTMRYVVSHGLERPFVMFRKEYMIQIIAAYMSIIYGVMYITTVSTTAIFTEIYHQSVGIAGTNFIAQGLGFIIWAQIQGRLSDRIYGILKKRNGGVGKPEFRLIITIPGSLFLPLGLLLYGWAAQRHLHWILPDLGMAFIAAGMIGNFHALMTFMIEAYTLHAASALAAATFCRSLFGFGFPLFAPYMFTAMGYGWGCTLLAGIAIIIGWPAGPFLYMYGERIRMRSSYAT